MAAESPSLFQGVPLPVFTIKWCPVCGRTDRLDPFKSRHFARGAVCPGTPVKLIYRDPEVQDA